MHNGCTGAMGTPWKQRSLALLEDTSLCESAAGRVEVPTPVSFGLTPDLGPVSQVGGSISGHHHAPGHICAWHPSPGSLFPSVSSLHSRSLHLGPSRVPWTSPSSALTLSTSLWRVSLQKEKRTKTHARSLLAMVRANTHPRAPIATATEFQYYR